MVADKGSKQCFSRDELFHGSIQADPEEGREQLNIVTQTAILGMGKILFKMCDKFVPNMEPIKLPEFFVPRKFCKFD